MHEHLLIDIFVEQRDLHFERLDVAISHIRSYLLQGYDNKQMVVSPEIRFIYDTSIEYGKHIDEVIEKINK